MQAGALTNGTGNSDGMLLPTNGTAIIAGKGAAEDGLWADDILSVATPGATSIVHATPVPQWLLSAF